MFLFIMVQIKKHYPTPVIGGVGLIDKFSQTYKSYF